VVLILVQLPQNFLAEKSILMFLRLGLFLWAGVVATPISRDACAAIAGETFLSPPDALACLRSFSFNETLRENILSTISRVLDSYTFEDYYPKSSFPFQNMVDMRAELARINSTSYIVSSGGYSIADSTYTTLRRTTTLILTCIILSTR
jgi:hypothetical protein